MRSLQGGLEGVQIFEDKSNRSRYKQDLTRENRNQQVEVREKQISPENFLTARTAQENWLPHLTGRVTQEPLTVRMLQHRNGERNWVVSQVCLLFPTSVFLQDFGQNNQFLPLKLQNWQYSSIIILWWYKRGGKDLSCRDNEALCFPMSVVGIN